MFAEGRRLYSDKVCLLKAGGCIQTKFVCLKVAVFIQLNSDNVCLLKAEGCIQTMYVS